MLGPAPAGSPYGAGVAWDVLSNAVRLDGGWDWWAMRVWYATGDCERVLPGLIGQPANAVSAVAYLLAGGWLLVRVCRKQAAPRRYWWLAAAVAANGVGSGLYHGPGWPGSRWCHDVAAIAVPVLIAADGLGGIRGWDDRTITRVGLGAVAVVAAAGVGPATNLTFLMAVGAAVLAEVAVAGRRPVPPPADGLAEVDRATGRRSRGIMLAALAVGMTAYLLGRTGGPLCRPDSLLQPHALWHLLTAVAMAAWTVDRISNPVPARTARPHP
jgi:hypothetical protein